MYHSVQCRLAALAAAFALTSALAVGNTITVTTTADNNSSQPVIAGSLRAALASANDNDTIVFDPSLKGKTIKLSAGQLAISKSINIVGLGTDKLTISGNGKSRVFYINTTATVTFSAFAVSLGNGKGADLSGAGYDANGGAVLNLGSLAAANVAFNNSKANGSGGGIFNAGSLSLVDSTVAYNTANAGSSSAPQSNGGGIADIGALSISRSTISNNRSFGDGGGIEESGTLALIDSTISTNKAAGFGGGVADGGFATIAISDCTFSLNSASNGGGLAASSPLPVSWTVANTILSGDTAATSPEIGLSVATGISQGFNLVGNTSGIPAGSLVASDIVNVSANLGPLQDNNGPTFTMALLPGSPAIAAGSNSLVPAGVVADQRGYGRINQGTVDIGAFEFYAPKDLKQDALNIVTADYNQNCSNISDWETNLDLWLAETLIHSSLRPVLWNGADKSRLSSWGELDFEYEEGAAGALNDLAESNGTFAADAQDALENLVMADNLLALTAINDAIAANGSTNAIRNAQNEVGQAQTALTKNKFVQAIEHYEQAWIDAQRAKNVTTGYDDGSDETERCRADYPF